MLSHSARSQLPRWVNKSNEEEATNEEQEKEQDPDKKPEERQPVEPPKASTSASTSSSSAAPANGNAAAGAPPADNPSSSSTDLQKPSVPDVYPQVLALPIIRRPLFPGFYKAVVIRDKAVVAAIKEMLKRGQPYVGAFLLKNEDSDSDVITDIDSVHPVGVFAQITSTFTNVPNKDVGKDKDGKKEEPSEDLTVVLYPHRRIRITELLPPSQKQAKAAVHDIQAQAEAEGVIPAVPTPPEEDVVTSFESSAHPASAAPSSTLFQTSFLQDYAVSRVNVENLQVEPYRRGTNNIIKAVSSEIISVFKDIAQLNPLFRDQIANFSMSSGAHNVFDDPEKLADFSAAVSTGEPSELQAVLESLVIEDRLQKALLVLKKELLNAQLQSKISKDVESKIQKRQREYYLHEQLKGIKKELGIESDGKDKMVEKFMEKAKSLNMPEGVRKVFDEEISKLQHLEPAASEFNVTRNYRAWREMTSVRSEAEFAVAQWTGSLKSHGVVIQKRTLD
jgi:Lon-like ATP-dependent protease